MKKIKIKSSKSNKKVKNKKKVIGRAFRKDKTNIKPTKRTVK
jgi:hypothetical protein